VAGPGGDDFAVSPPLRSVIEKFVYREFVRLHDRAEKPELRKKEPPAGFTSRRPTGVFS
jgi:hypothetical protein